MKATKSKDGLMRIDVTIKARASIIELTCALAVHLSEGGQVPWTRRDIAHIYKDELLKRGEGLYYVGDHVDEPTMIEAKGRVLEFFPELAAT